MISPWLAAASYTRLEVHALIFSILLEIEELNVYTHLCTLEFQEWFIPNSGSRLLSVNNSNELFLRLICNMIILYV